MHKPYIDDGVFSTNLQSTLCMFFVVFFFHFIRSLVRLLSPSFHFYIHICIRAYTHIHSFIAMGKIWRGVIVFHLHSLRSAFFGIKFKPKQQTARQEKRVRMNQRDRKQHSIFIKNIQRSTRLCTNVCILTNTHIHTFRVLIVCNVVANKLVDYF